MPKESKYLPDGSVDLTEPIGNEFDDYFDELHSKYAPQTNDLSVDQRESLIAEERQFMREMARAISQHLHTQGFRAIAVRPGEHEYVITANDTEGREFTVSFTIDEALEEMEQHPEEKRFDRVLVDQVCRAILLARDQYFARMQ